MTAPSDIPAQRQIPQASTDTMTNLSPPSATPTPKRDIYDIMEAEIRNTKDSAQESLARERQMALQRDWTREDLERQVTRRWRVGDVYAPHDLSGAEAAKWKKLRRKGKTQIDVLDQLGINPKQHYKASGNARNPLTESAYIPQNFSMMSEYMTDMGRIKHRRETSLRPVNQRRMAKAIRRAIGVGLMPGVHRHPEILREERRERQNRR